jgi:hypothetical protein
MPKMVRWEKVEGVQIPIDMRDAIAVYKDTKSVFYLGNFDHSNGSTYEHRWKILDKDGTCLKGQYNCCGFRLKFPPIKWATEVVDNKYEASNGNGDKEDTDDNEREFKGVDSSEVDDTDNERKSKVSMESIIAAVQEEDRQSEEPVKPKRGRKAGSKNKPKTGYPLTVKKNGRGRPKGSKNKPK